MKELLAGLALIVALSGCGKKEAPEYVLSRNVDTPGGTGIQYVVKRGDEIDTYIFKGDRFFGKNLVYLTEKNNSIVFTRVDPSGFSKHKQRYKLKIMGL